MKNYYIVAFDRDPEKGYRKFHKTFTSHPRIQKWWHYIKSSYIVGTDMNEDEITDHFIESAEKHDIDTTHLVLRVDLRYRYGMLTEDAWEWIDKNCDT